MDFLDVGDEGDATTVEDPQALNGPELFCMFTHDPLGILLPRLFPDPANVQRPILPLERTNTAHIVSVICKLIPSETIDTEIELKVRRIRQPMKPLAGGTDTVEHQSLSGLNG